MSNAKTTTAMNTTSTTQEFWRDIEDSNHQVSSLGNIRNIKTGLLLNPCVNSSGYKIIRINHLEQGVVKNYTVHGLVAKYFLGHIPKGFKSVIDHIDNNPLNNELTNLQIISQRENCTKDKHKGNYSSKYVGVHATGKKFGSSIRFSSKKINLGTFSCEKTASIVYELAKRITTVDATVEERLLMIDNLKKEMKEVK